MSNKNKEIVEEFFWYIQTHHYEKVREFLELGKVSPDVVSIRGDETPAILYAVQQSRGDGTNPSYFNIIKLLLEKGANVNKTSANGETALMEAAEKDFPELTKELLRYGADVNAKDKNYGWTPLIHAVLYGDYKKPEAIENIKILLDAGADPSLLSDTGRGHEGLSALHYAAQDNVEAVKILLDSRKVDVNILSSSSDNSYRGPFTPLYHAIGDDDNSFEIVDTLLDYGADPDIPEQKSKQTPLMKATTWNHLERMREIIKLLLKDGADKNLRDIDGKTAADYAKEAGNFDLLDLLEPEEENTSELWKGLTQADVGLFNAFFEDTENYSCCPVCLGFIQRSEACRYMKHNCRETTGVIPHKKLYDLYKNDEGKIFWCTICGRICMGHRHYELAPYQATEKPELTESKYGNNLGLFGGEAECIADGGGGLAEKVKRFERMIAYAKELQEDVGKISEKEARKQLVEEAWNAPMARRRNIGKILEQKKFTTNISAFPAAFPNTNNKKNNNNTQYPDIPKLPGEEKPIFNKHGTNVVYGDTGVPTLQFIHDNKGVINRHEDRAIGLPALEDFIKLQTREFGDPKFGYCFDYPGCQGRIYPQDIEPYFTGINVTNNIQSVFHKYRREFNKKFSAEAQRGGANGIMVNISNTVQCVTKRKGGFRKTRKNHKAKKQTRRSRK